MYKIKYFTLIFIIIILFHLTNSQQTQNCNAPTDAARLTCQFLSMSDNIARVI